MTDSPKDSFVTSAALAAYQVIFAAGILAFMPYALVKMTYTPSYRAGLAQRLSLKILNGAGTKTASPAWIQAVSLGEVKSVAPLIKKIVQETGCPIHLSATTETGHKMANELFSQKAQIAYFPLDFRWSTGRILSRIQPRVVILFETEIWPNLIHNAASRNIPIVIVNGRISEASYKCYRIIAPLFRATFSRITMLGMQSAADARRATALGARPETVKICGNMKFDAAAQPPSAKDIEKIRAELLMPVDAPLIVGGSTHEGEEKALLKALHRLQAKNASIRLLLAPRHPERFETVEKIIRDEGFDALRRSRIPSGSATPGPRTVILLDTIGELSRIYALATVAFVGGSLADVGGHNIIEPASVGVPVIIGPHMHHFKDVRDAFQSENAVLCVSSEEELYKTLKELLEDPSRARSIGEAAKHVVQEHQGATDRYFRLLLDFL